MSDHLYQIFLDWLRRRDAVVLRLEDGTILASGFRPRSEFEESDTALRLNKTRLRVFGSTLGVLRQKHGALIDDFLAEWDGEDPGLSGDGDDIFVNVDGTAGRLNRRG